MAVDLKTLSPSQLQALIQDANARLAGARNDQIRDVRAQIESILKKSDLTIDDVYPTRAGKKAKAGKAGDSRKGSKKGTKVAPKYRNPENPAEQWTGRGRQPAWFVAALKKRGVTIESLLIGGGKATTRKVAKKAVKKTVRRKAKG